VRELQIQDIAKRHRGRSGQARVEGVIEGTSTRTSRPALTQEGATAANC